MICTEGYKPEQYGVNNNDNDIMFKDKDMD
jgi:hypothetical protein